MRPAEIDVMAPVDAFREILRARFPKHCAHAEHIDFGWLNRSCNRADNCTRDDLKAAETAIKELRDGVREGLIGLRGTYQNGPPATIDQGDRRLGELDVFDQKLELSNDGKVVRIYRDVFCVKADIMRLVEPANAAKRGRKPHDWDTIERRVCDLMEEHGDFGPDNKGFENRARLEEKVRDEFEIGRTQLAKRLPAILERWRSGYKRAGN